jgi:uncharacterized membrane protein
MKRPLKVAAWCGAIPLLLSLIAIPIIFLIQDKTIILITSLTLSLTGTVLSIFFLNGFVVLGKKFENKLLTVMAWMGIAIIIISLIFNVLISVTSLGTIASAEEIVLQNCTDTDKGQDYETKGYVVTPIKTFYDYCDEDTLHEFYCPDPTRYETLTQEGHDCPHGCFEGRCLKESEKIEDLTWCNDTDGGLNYIEKGTIYSYKFPEGRTDKCDTQIENRLGEYTCQLDKAGNPYRFVTCLDGCEDGACVSNKILDTDKTSTEKSSILPIISSIIIWVVFSLIMGAYYILFGIGLLKIENKVEHAKTAAILEIISGATVIIFIGFLIKLVATIFEIVMFFKASEKLEK